MIINVDLDGVICSEEKTFERALAKPMPGAREALQKLRSDGHIIVIYSARSWAEVRITSEWLKTNGIPYDGLHFGKPIADRFIDDRAVAFRDWDTALKELGSGPAQFGAQDEAYLRILREATARILREIVSRCEPDMRVLEVGPMTPDSKVFDRMNDTYVDTRAEFAKKDCRYYSLDVDAGSRADVIGDFLKADELLPHGSFDLIVMASCLEHMPRFWEAPRVLKTLLKPGGSAHILTPWNIRFHGPRPDCWRISDDGYEALFRDQLRIERIEKIPCPNRPLMPIGLYCVVTRD